MPHENPDPAPLGDLLHAVFRGLRRGWAEQLAPFGLTPHQFRALNALAGHPGAQEHRHEAEEACRRSGRAGSLRVKDLAQVLRIAPGRPPRWWTCCRRRGSWNGCRTPPTGAPRWCR